MSGIDEGFGEVNRMAVHPIPIVRQGARHLPQNVRRQMRNLNPGQNQKARVRSNETDVAAPFFGTPSCISVPAAQVARRRTPRQARDRSALGAPDTSVLAHRLLVTQVVMVLYQAIEQRLLGRAPGLCKSIGPSWHSEPLTGARSISGGCGRWRRTNGFSEV
jgi:hypothetical protein